MSRAQVKRLRKVGNYRAFQGWTDEGRATELGRVNLIYGTNGSGKSTLANLFRACSSSAPEVQRAGLEFDVNVDGSPGVVTQASSAFWERVRVFNADYVRENLRFDDDAGPRSDSLLTLGKSNVDAEEQLRTAEARKAELEPLSREARSTGDALDRALQQRLTEVAGQIVDDLRASPVATYRATNSYTRANVRALLAGDRALFDGASRDIAADRAMATSEAKDAYTRLNRSQLPHAADLRDTAIELLKTDVTSRPLAALAGSSDRAAWVQKGVELHAEIHTCLFCDNAISAERRRDLAAHFDESLTDLQSRIDAHIELVKQVSATANLMVDSVPRDADLYPDLAGELRMARSEFRDQNDQFQDDIRKISDSLLLKRENPFSVASIDLPPLLVPSPQSVTEVVGKHEHKRSTHTDEAVAAARRVELARVQSLADDYDQRKAAVLDQNAKAEELATELRQLSELIITLSNHEADPVPQASELTSDVARLLGRADLKFEPSADGKHYRIERAGAPATHLSEGERTAIALLHFLASVRRGVVSGDEPIVVVDDPVSSMDDGILFGVSSFLWSSLVENEYASQVILLTHNFELFRQWVMQLENAGRHVSGGFTIHEIRMRYRPHRSGTPRRLPQLDPWTDDKKQSRRLRSLYHFLFARVAKSVTDASPELGLAERMDLLALVPNAARKMVEAFLSFRYPQHIGNFHAGMKAAMEALDDPAVRTHVERYLHTYSHNEEGNVSAMLDPSEASMVLRSLFLLIRANDSEHLSAMCQALEIDEGALFAIPN
ncbi:AAA family ATPase [Arthrobacter sp. MDT2-16]